MSELDTALIVLGIVLGATALGFFLRRRLAGSELDDQTRDVMRLAMGFIGTMAALVIGLLLYAAKGSYEDQRNALEDVAVSLALLDATLDQYGPEAGGVRVSIRDVAGLMIAHLWPEDIGEPSSLGSAKMTEAGHRIYSELLALAPQNDTQRMLKTEALQFGVALARDRLLLIAQHGTHDIPPLFIAVLTVWLAILFTGFGLFGKPNVTVVGSLLLSALAVSGAMFLILELDQPFHGLIRIPADALKQIYADLGP